MSLTEPSLHFSDTVGYFSEQAVKFSEQYHRKEEFIERFVVWSSLLDKYSSGKRTAYDIGCGSGIFSFYLAEKGLDVVGLDASPEMVHLCDETKQERAINNVQFLRAEVPFVNRYSFSHVDMIICSSVLEYVLELDQTLSLFRDLLNEAGILILSFPNKKSVYRKIEKRVFQLLGRPNYIKYVKHEFSLNECRRRLEKFGFVTLEARYFASVTTFSKILKLGFPAQFVDSLFVVVCQKKHQRQGA